METSAGWVDNGGKSRIRSVCADEFCQFPSSLARRQTIACCFALSCPLSARFSFHGLPHGNVQCHLPCHLPPPPPATPTQDCEFSPSLCHPVWLLFPCNGCRCLISANDVLQWRRQLPRPLTSGRAHRPHSWKWPKEVKGLNEG